MDYIKGIKPWLIAQDMFTKVKDELVLEAIDILHEQVEKKRISIEGYTVTLPDQQADVDRDIFILNKILAEAGNIRSQYSEYMKDSAAAGEKDARLIERIEELRKLLLAISEIEMLMSMSDAAKDMIELVSMHVTESDVAEVIAKAASESHNTAMIELMKYIQGSKRFAKACVFDDAERGIINKADALYLEMNGGKDEDNSSEASS